MQRTLRHAVRVRDRIVSLQETSATADEAMIQALAGSHVFSDHVELYFKVEEEVYTTADMSYAGTPCYSITPKDSEMETPAGFAHLRFSRRSDDPLIIVNKGIGFKGFSVCMDCGAVAPADDDTPLGELPKPYRHPHKHYQCHHDGSGIATVFLGHQFRMERVVLQIQGKEAEQIRKSVYSILRQEQREQQSRRAQDMER